MTSKFLRKKIEQDIMGKDMIYSPECENVYPHL